MKLLMVATKETKRPYMSHLLWEMRKKASGSTGHEANSGLHSQPSKG